MHDALGKALADRRVKAVLPHVRGRLLDLGCGTNNLVRTYASLSRRRGDAAKADRSAYAAEAGVGVDVHPWPGADIVVPDSASLAWESQSFDTITIIAALNHMPNRQAVLQECRRILRPDGRVVITMITPRTSRVWHWLRSRSDADQVERGMKPGEVYGFTPAEIVELFSSCGFTLESQRRFMLGFNCVYVFRPTAPSAVYTALDKKAS